MSDMAYGDFGSLRERRVLGFDIRINPNRQMQAFSEDWRRKKIYAQESPCLLTLDPEVWNSPISNQSSLLRNGYNLLFEIDEGLIQQVRNRDENDVMVAFDIPVRDYDAISGTFGHGCYQPDIDATKLFRNGWIFLGFDIVDPRTQLSGLVSFDYEPNEWNSLLQELKTDINFYGLFSHASIAHSVSAEVSKLIPEHAPFCPCGIWIGVANGELILAGNISGRNKEGDETGVNASK